MAKEPETDFIGLFEIDVEVREAQNNNHTQGITSNVVDIMDSQVFNKML